VCAQGTLIDFVLAQPARKANEAQTRAAGAQMLSALAHGHALGFAHRDVKARSTPLPLLLRHAHTFCVRCKPEKRVALLCVAFACSSVIGAAVQGVRAGGASCGRPALRQARQVWTGVGGTTRDRGSLHGHLMCVRARAVLTLLFVVASW
jgi:hypothetical protein